MGFSMVGNVLGGVTGGIMDASGARDTFSGQAPNITKQDLLSKLSSAENAYGQITPAQQALAQALTAQSQGQGPNIAQLQLEQATNRNIEQNAGLLGSQRGMNPALASRLIAQNSARAGQEAAGQSGIMRAQQQLAAQSQLGGLLGTEAQQEIQRQQILQGAQAAQNSAINQGALGAQGLTADASKQNSQTAGQIAGGLMGGAGSAAAAMFSDERVKKDITDANKSSYDFLEKIGAHKYKYKDKSMGEGEYISPMAQELEKTPQGKDLVEDTPAGKVVDMGHAAGLLMANQAALHDRLKELESHKMAKGGKVPIVVSPGELHLSKRAAKKVADGHADPLEAAHKIPGKAKVKGDSSKNDTIDREAEPGDVIVPRTKADDSDKAAEFVKALKKDKSEPSGYSRVLDAKRKLKEAMQHLQDIHKGLES